MLYANNNTRISALKIRYYANYSWRLMFLINTNNVYNTLTKRIYNSSTSIPYMFVGYEVLIYSGIKWLSRIIVKWSVGYKVGTLSWNRKRSLFKSKQLKKK